MKHQPAPVGPEPRTAAEVFGESLPTARRFAAILADTGVSRGLIGPRETERLWTRHLLNCAVLETLLPHRTRIIDVGSGAGLPGLVLAIVRHDLDVVLVEPMLRRTTWLQEVVDELELGNVSIHRGRAQEFRGRLQAPVVTARAVARLGELATFCAPLVAPGGRLLAMKGESAEQELTQDRPVLIRLGVEHAEVLSVGEPAVTPATRVVALTFGARPARGAARGGTRGAGRGGAGAAAGAARRAAQRHTSAQ